MKKIDKTAIITSLVCLIPIIIGIIIYNKLPEQLPTHFDFKGEVDSYSSKNFTVFCMPLILCALNLFTHFMLNNDPKKRNIDKFFMNIGKWTIPVVSIIVLTITYLVGMEIHISVEKFVPAMISLLFIVIGNYLPKCKQNYTAGIRLPWTLGSEENWNRTHRLAGFIWLVAGVVLFVSSFISSLPYLFFPVVIVMVIVPMIYSYLLFKKGI